MSNMIRREFFRRIFAAVLAAFAGVHNKQSFTQTQRWSLEALTNAHKQLNRER